MVAKGRGKTSNPTKRFEEVCGNGGKKMIKPRPKFSAFVRSAESRDAKIRSKS